VTVASKKEIRKGVLAFIITSLAIVRLSFVFMLRK